MASLASYRRCCDRLTAAWPGFLAMREECLAQERRFGTTAEKVAENILEDLFANRLGLASLRGEQPGRLRGPGTDPARRQAPDHRGQAPGRAGVDRARGRSRARAGAPLRRRAEGPLDRGSATASCSTRATMSPADAGTGHSCASTRPRRRRTCGGSARTGSTGRATNPPVPACASCRPGPARSPRPRTYWRGTAWFTRNTGYRPGASLMSARRPTRGPRTCLVSSRTARRTRPGCPRPSSQSCQLPGLTSASPRPRSPKSWSPSPAQPARWAAARRRRITQGIRPAPGNPRTTRPPHRRTRPVKAVGTGAQDKHGLVREDLAEPVHTTYVAASDIRTPEPPLCAVSGSSPGRGGEIPIRMIWVLPGGGLRFAVEHPRGQD